MKTALLSALGVLILAFIYLITVIGLACFVNGINYMYRSDDMNEKLPDINELNNMYDTDERFKEYVDRWCTCRNKTKEEVLKTKMAAYKALDLKGDLTVGEHESHVTKINCGC